ncbi:MAG: twin-arginine translocase TatA/TatE family subunit [Planctomycetaceae bacterium]
MFPNLGPLEMILVMGVAVLLFGKRLPEVGRSLGKGIVEFRKGIRGIEEEFDLSSSSSRAPARRPEPRARSSDDPEASVPKFEPPSGAPIPQMESESPPAHDGTEPR